jgi:hypothetical protein
MKNPILMKDGQTYEREAIAEWLKVNGTSPITKTSLKLEDGILNTSLKAAIQDATSKPLHITVHFKLPRHAQDKIFPICIWDTILNLKKKIQNATNVPVPSQTITLDGVPVIDESTIEEHLNEEIPKFVVECSPIQIIAEGNRKYILEIYPFDTLLDVKQLFSNRTGISYDELHCVWQGKPLDNKDILMKRGVAHNHALRMLMRLRGGFQ